MPAPETLKVTFEKICYAKPADSDGLKWGIYLVEVEHQDKLKIIKGCLDQDITKPGMVFEVVGRWETDRKYGKQFKFHAYSRCQAAGREGTEAFLTQADNIGTVTAGNIYDVYGDQSVNKIIDEPEEVASKCGVRLEIIQSAAEKLAPLYNEAKAKLPLLTLFKGTKIASKTAQRIVDAKWNDAVERLKLNPFLLMEEFTGIAFRQCDSLRVKLKLPKDMPERIAAACKQAFADSSDQAWLKVKSIQKPMMDLLELKTPYDDFVETWVTQLVEDKVLRSNEFDTNYYALNNHARDEESVAAQLAMRMSTPGDDWPIEEILDDPDLTDHQKGVVINNMKIGGRLMILPGSPGTGKTYTIAKIIKAFAKKTGWLHHACAPTGKAAQRFDECLKENDIHSGATTIHRMLEPLPLPDGGFGFRLQGGDGGYVNVDLVAIDETSMVNNYLGASAFRGIHPETYVILVGDQNQLPPVGPGTMLRDLQTLGFQELTKIERNDGKIVRTCAAIRDKKDFTIPCVDSPGKDVTPDNNVQLILCKKDEKKAVKIRRLVERMLAGDVDGVRPDNILETVQFITATHKNPHVGRAAMNVLLQGMMNPSGKGDHEFYKVGDKIICTENCQIKDPDDPGVKSFVANGELGYVVESHEKWIVARMNSHKGKLFKIPCGAELGNGWDHGFCITCHKSQGSEWHICVTVMGDDFGSKMVMGRSWIYTAISRSKYCSIIVSTPSLIKEVAKKIRIWDRKSFIIPRLNKLMSKPKEELPV